MLFCPRLIKFTSMIVVVIWLISLVGAKVHKVSVETDTTESVCQREIVVKEIASEYHLVVEPKNCTECVDLGSCAESQNKKRCTFSFSTVSYLKDFYKLCFDAAQQDLDKCACPRSVKKKKRQSCGPQILFKEKESGHDSLESEDRHRGALTCARRKGPSKCVSIDGGSLSMVYKGGDFCGVSGFTKVYLMPDERNLYDLSNWRRCNIYTSGGKAKGVLVSQLSRGLDGFPERCYRMLHSPWSSNSKSGQFCFTFVHADFVPQGATLMIRHLYSFESRNFSSENRPTIGEEYCLKWNFYNRIAIIVRPRFGGDADHQYKHTFVLRYEFKAEKKRDKVTTSSGGDNEEEEEDDDGPSTLLIAVYVFAPVACIVFVRMMWCYCSQKARNVESHSSDCEDGLALRDPPRSNYNDEDTRLSAYGRHQSDSSDSSSDVSITGRPRPDTPPPPQPSSRGIRTSRPASPSTRTATRSTARLEPSAPLEPASSSSLPPSYEQVMHRRGSELESRTPPVTPSVGPAPDGEETENLPLNAEESVPPPPAYSSLFPDQT
ncbi:uncharacterized protein LOC101853762 [Aplysia californica]|uniref:Uncharacterized protein LOC101853762 n=1 Tax=Aplysia californica TaxID=6500 RepID=A0ABM1W5A4_APLCA|nr:uncharacterized protein LOC101853762 [Aplysia californica]XP_035829847.1 uncharacterized protein LOC101853762 [Aplysia californica]XP_035829848.1 uncharacterized protein LOC101853762 [Aplysia californica]